MAANHDTERKAVESLILTFKRPVKIYDLQRFYEKSFGKKIPYLELGFTSLEDFILSMEDSIIARYCHDGSLILTAKANNDVSKNIKNLIDNQKVTTTKKRIPRYKNTGSYRSTSYRQNDFQAQQRIKELLNAHPRGLNAKELQLNYYKTYPFAKEDLNYKSLGHNCIEDLLGTCDSNMLSIRGSNKERVFYSSESSIVHEVQQKPLEGPERKVLQEENIDDLRVQNDEIFITFELEFFKDIVSIPLEVGEVYSPDNFYIIIKEKHYSEALDELALKMKDFYLKQGNMDRWKIHPLDVVYEHPVVVFHQMDKMLYRGVVTGIKGIEVQVYLVDYGTNCIVDKENLLHLHKSFFDLPAQAINAKLFNLKMKSQSVTDIQRASKRMLELVNCKESILAYIHFVDVENYSFSLELYEKDGYKSINEELVKEGYCLYINKSEELKLDISPFQNSIQSERINILEEAFQHQERECTSKENSSVAGFYENVDLPSISENHDVYKNVGTSALPDFGTIKNNEGASSTVDIKFQNDHLMYVTDKVDTHDKSTKETLLKFKSRINSECTSPINIQSDSGNISPVNDEVITQNLEMYNSFPKACNGNDLPFEDNNSTVSSTSENCFNLELLNAQISDEDDKIVAALRSLKDANHCIRLERKKILAQLPGNSSLREPFIRLSTVKANIIAMEAELIGIFQLRKENN